MFVPVPGNIFIRLFVGIRSKVAVIFVRFSFRVWLLQLQMYVLVMSKFLMITLPLWMQGFRQYTVVHDIVLSMLMSGFADMFLEVWVSVWLTLFVKFWWRMLPPLTVKMGCTFFDVASRVDIKMLWISPNCLGYDCLPLLFAVMVMLKRTCKAKLFIRCFCWLAWSERHCGDWFSRGWHVFIWR